METVERTLVLLLDRVGQIFNTGKEWLKLKSIETISQITSNVAYALILGTGLLFTLFFISIGISIWVGEFLGKLYLGFLIVAAFYFICFIVILLLGSVIKGKVLNKVITLLYESSYENN